MTYRWSPLAIVFALIVATASPNGAEAQGLGRRAIGDYSFSEGGRVRVEVDGPRIMFFAADGSGSRVLVYLDPSSVERWLVRADALMRGGGRTSPGAETQTPPLTNADPSAGGSVVLTREEVPRRGGVTTQYYLTAMGDADHLALLPLSSMDARIVTAALRRATDALRGRGR